MGWFSSVFSTVKSAASAVWQGAKEVAAKVVEWMATKAEGFVDAVKNVYKQHISPHISKIQAGLLFLAAKAPWPWVKGAALALDAVLTALTAFENSQVAKAVDQAIKWLITLAKRLHGTDVKATLTDEELKEAQVHQATVRDAIVDVPAENQESVAVLAALNDYAIAITQLERVRGSGEIKGLDHELRLRTTAKLLSEARVALENGKNVQDITSDDRFLLQISTDLVKPDPQLSEESAQRLAAILMKRHGKLLATFVFEEMIVGWEEKHEALEATWKVKNKELAEATVILRRLEAAKEFSELGGREQEALSHAQVNVPKLKTELEACREDALEMRIIVHAAEGFLQMLEKTPDELEAAGRDWLAEDGPEVGNLILQCTEHGRKWKDLTQDERNLLVDFANIFGEDCKKRVILVEAA